MIKNLCCVLLGVFLLTAAGCASRERRADPGESGVVVAYHPKGLMEYWAQSRLAAADNKARGKIPGMLERAERATSEYYGAALALTAEELPPDIKRPTEEEVKVLREKCKVAWATLKKAVDAQVALYEEFMKKYPHNWYARHRLAWFLADHHRRYRAAEQWRRVIEMEPRFPYAYNNLGSLYNHMGRDMEAVDLFLKTIELKSDDPVFHVNLAVNYSTQRYEVARKFGWTMPRVFEESIRAYKRALALAPKPSELPPAARDDTLTDVDIAYDLATQYVLAKHFGLEDTADEAFEAWRYYLKLELTPTQRGVACRSIGRIYLTEKGDFAQAATWLEKAVELTNDPGSKNLLKRARAAPAGFKTAR